MYHSIQYFVENVILQMEKNQKNFMENPSKPGEYIKKVEQILLEFDCHVVSEAFAHRFRTSCIYTYTFPT